MSETSARASLFARSPGSRARNGLIGRRSPGTGVAAGAGVTAGMEREGGVTGGTETGATGVWAAGTGVIGCHGVLGAAGVGRSGGSDAPSAGMGGGEAVTGLLTAGVGIRGWAAGVGIRGCTGGVLCRACSAAGVATRGCATGVGIRGAG
jgi:hypothetical protein